MGVGSGCKGVPFTNENYLGILVSHHTAFEMQGALIGEVRNNERRLLWVQRVLRGWRLKREKW